jgi:hypothetical protein
MIHTRCEHIAANDPHATLTFTEIKAALCSACLASEIIALGSVLNPSEIGPAITFHPGAKGTREAENDCITITNDLLRNDAAGDKARAAVKKQRLEAQRLRALGRKPKRGVLVVPPAQRATA